MKERLMDLSNEERIEKLERQVEALAQMWEKFYQGIALASGQDTFRIPMLDEVDL